MNTTRRILLIGLVATCVWNVKCGGGGRPEGEVDRLVRTINDNPNKLHSQYTPSVEGLISIGAPAIPRLLDLMETGDYMTRMRAEAALERITMEAYGFVPGRGWSRPTGQDEWGYLWESLGSLDYKACEEMRRHSVALWRRWFAERPASRVADSRPSSTVTF
jgi:hypothetical protein